MSILHNLNANLMSGKQLIKSFDSSMKPTTLTLKGISTVIESKSTPVILQVINLQENIKDVDQGKAFMSQVSDGYTKLKCYWGTALYDRVLSLKNQFNGAIVVLTQYVATMKKILVTSFDMIYLYDEIIGDPVSYRDYLANQKSEHATNLIDLTKAIKFNEDSIPASKPSSVPAAKTIEKENTTSNTKENRTSNYKPQKIKTKETKEYQLIEDLYASMDGWTLYCRIIKLNYRQFENKKKTLTRLCEFQLMDKNDWTIKANIFGDYGLKMSQNLKQGQVYTFSVGQIKMDTYNKPINKKDSPYLLYFNQHSKICLSTNDESIKNGESTLNYISDIEKCPVGGEIDCACIIKEVQPEVTVPNKNNNGESYAKRIVVICDPIRKVQAQVTLWRNQTNLIKSSDQKKPVVLQNFRINEYKNSLFLVATLKSRITELKDHDLNKASLGTGLGEFESISHLKKQRADQSENIATMKELLEKVEYLQEKQVLWSTFRVYVNRIKETGKKWYAGCPNSSCKKSIDEDSLKCPHCKVAVPKPTFRYVLGVQIADALGTGYLWATAHDDFANKILGLWNPLSAEEARRYSDDDFNEAAKRCLFQEFKVTMSSKIEIAADFKRRVKHNVVSYAPINSSKQAMSNLDKINAMKKSK